MISTEQIQQKLEPLINPHTQQSFAKDKLIKQITLQDDALHITLSFGYPVKNYQTLFSQLIVDALKDTVSAENIHISMEQNIQTHQVKMGVQTINGVKNIIAVASGKGGVGKSTTTTNLALTLSQMGARVGVLDADLYGPSQPTMLGVADQKPKEADGFFIPVLSADNIQVMSIGFLVDANQSVVWRGPMLSQALQQLLFQSKWDDLDYLLIDLPPGTGDIQLTLAQKVPVTASVIVTTPQDIALLDAKKAIDMFEKVAIPVVGILENMSVHLCSQCGHQEAIFGEGGGEKLAQTLHVPLLGKLPLDLSIRLAMDEGAAGTLLQQEKNGQIAALYQEAALQIAVYLAKKGKDFSSKMPKIVVQ